MSPKPLGRYELKYLVTEDQAHAIAEYAAPFCAPDPNLPEPTGQYTITSIYLDSPNLHLYWDKKTLQPNRHKVRIRTYGKQCDGPIFAEVKRRYGDIIVKSRTTIPRSHWTRILLPDGDARLSEWGLSDRSRATVEDFRAQCDFLGLQPLVAVRYQREPYVGRWDPTVRFTFDRALQYCSVTRVEFPGDTRAYRPVDIPAVFDAPQSRVILEMKFNLSAPLWMEQIVHQFDLIRSSFSKYGNSVEQMREEPYRYGPGLLCSAVV